MQAFVARVPSFPSVFFKWRREANLLCSSLARRWIGLWHLKLLLMCQLPRKWLTLFLLFFENKNVRKAAAAEWSQDAPRVHHSLASLFVEFASAVFICESSELSMSCSCIYV